MSSAVNELQRAIVDGQQSLTQLLRKTKLIAAKLGLDDIEKWVDLELNGYPTEADSLEIPKYRIVQAESLMIHNPYRGWQYAGDVHKKVEVFQPITDVEMLSQQEQCTYSPPNKYTITNSIGTTEATNWPQRIVISPSEFKGVLEAVRNELLQWAINLEKRGIKGENMNFDDKEKQTAGHMTFNIGTVQGGVGNISNSPITVNANVRLYDYSSVQQLLIDHKIPKQDRRELEDIMDELKEAQPEKKPSLLARAEKWIVKHKELLGTGVELIGKAIGSAVEGGNPKH